MTASSKPRTRDPDAKRAALHAAALQAFAQDGYGATSMSGIAKRAGMAVGTIYRFYPDKLSLLGALHAQIEDHVIMAMDAAWQTDGSFAERLDTLIAALFALFEAQRETLSMLAMTTDMIGPDGDMPADRIRARIRDYCEDAVAAGAFRAQNTRTLAALLHGTVDGAMRHYLAGRSSRARLCAQTQDFLRAAVLAPDR